MLIFRWKPGDRQRIVARIGQFIKFGTVGVSNTLLSLAIYYLLIHFGVHYLLANAAGFVVSVCNSYFWNSRLVFKNKQEKSGIKAFLKVFASYGVSFLLSCTLMLLFVQALGVSEYFAPILRLLFTIPLNYFLNKMWAFKDKL